jgi:hypothetical protein
VPPRDAEPAEFPDRRYRRIRPQYPPACWVRVGGVWLTGHVNVWIKVEDRWIASIDHQHPDGWGYPAHGLYVYDPETIRRRGQGEPPPG